MSNCRSCNAEVDWVKLKSGKAHPVNPEYLAWNDANEGDKLVTDTGDILSVKKSLNYPNVKGRLSHFATCPDATEWRKKK